MGSVRLILRGIEQCDLVIEEIPKGNCRISIKSDPAADDGIVVDLSIRGGGEPENAEREVDHPVDQAATEHNVAERDRDGMRIANQVCLFNAHQYSPF